MELWKNRERDEGTRTEEVRQTRGIGSLLQVCYFGLHTERFLSHIVLT